MSPELKKAIIRSIPDYFSWDKRRQEQYRVDTPEEDTFRIKQFLLRDLFNISVSNGDGQRGVFKQFNSGRLNNW